MTGTMSIAGMHEFFYKMYEEFGQWAVINFVKDRQDNGQLQNISWKECTGCEFYTPYMGNDCLVCGGHLC